MNGYTFDQIATILNNIVADAQGRTADISTTPRDTSSFVAMANTALSAGTDPIMRSITSLINRSVFAFRPYTRKFKMLDTDSVTFGNAVRKITPIFTDGAEVQPMYDSQPADGNSTDQWKIKRPKSLETVFVGASQYEVQAPTVFVDQLKTAFRNPEELGQFLSAQIGEVSNEIEQQAEQLARMTVANLIGAKLTADTGSVVHLLTEYNSLTGLSGGDALTAATVFQPENFPAFIKWVYARIETVANFMTERSTLWHQGIDGYTILRHTPKEDLRLMTLASADAQIKTMVMSGLYHDKLLNLGQHEAVGFWQNINDPMEINVTASYIGANGAVASDTVSEDAVFAVLYDKDAMGCNIFDNSVDMTPVNAKGRYYNTYYHFAKRYWNDTTENAAVFLLD